ncbi:hypothetical protein NL108_011558 [Boleophthalmus pectinirostris]|nr:hypothetical protein NL108_011558 [Boleophthalmus pectinirostris]
MDLVIWSEMESLLNLFCSVVYVVVYLKNCSYVTLTVCCSLLLFLLQLDFTQEMSAPGISSKKCDLYVFSSLLRIFWAGVTYTAAYSLKNTVVSVYLSRPHRK